MLVSIKWLKDYVNIELTAEELAHRLTMAGLEVDEIKTIRPQFSGVVVAKILSVKPHPSADRLSLCSVSDGKECYPVVCGAKNIAPGNIVPLAKVGAVIPGGYIIKSSALRGEKSDGMLCSEAELEIGDDASGIMHLPAGLSLGLPLETALNIEDTVLDVNVTPNRSDCLSMIGMAREVAAITGKKIKQPSVKVKESSEDINSLTSVRIIDADACPRYTARMIKNVQVGRSPVWIKTRLEAAGLRAINNIVDVTNFVMLEMGQPLHAFDFRFLEEGRIVVRKSKENEEFISLDGKSRTLPLDTLLICDGVKPVAIGGIMGGLNSEVKEDTQIILLESAYFNPPSIRRSARKLSMPTDAAFRFERGIDPEGVVKALNRAAQLIADLSGGYICKNYIDEYPQKIPSAQDIPLRLDRMRRIIGMEIGAKDVVRILRSIGMVLKQSGKGRYLVTPPTCRVDISREIDLIEEVIRLYGYDSVPVTLPAVAVTEMEVIPRLNMEERIRQLLIGSGYTEIVNYSFGIPVAADLLCLPENDERRRMVQIRNPLGEDLSAMRTTMIYGLLETAKKNANNGSFDLKIFEIGRNFFSRKNELPEEKNMLAGLLTGKMTDDLWGPQKTADFYILKGCLENIFFDLKINNCRYNSKDVEPFLHPGKSCGIYVDDKQIGFLGEVHPDVVEKINLKNNAYVFEINLDILVDAYLDKRISCQEISKFPAVTRDAAFVIPYAMEAEQMLNIVLGQKEDLLENVSIFDVYKGKEISAGTKSLGLRFSYRAPDRTLTDTEANNVHDGIVQKTVNLTGAKIRGE
ncbi:MAG: phenylalanine--tRNA ligase subunit beta [Deltaproteobacteria bacterium]|nr:phenylalanine--tRNA ligase subunit beta [Deltaproteobacteria bacterium]